MSRMYDRDPYAILGLSSTSTASQIKEAYHRLARRYHPDLNKDPRAIERMKDINWAYGILCDPQERSRYDLWRNSSIRAEYYHPGTSPSNSERTPPSSPPPHYTSPRTDYPNIHVTQQSHSLGCSTSAIAWVLIIVIINVVRAIQPFSQPENVYYPINVATQTAEMEKLYSAIQTFSASREPSSININTASPLYPLFFTPLPAATVLTDELGHRDMRSRIVPGSWEWERIHEYFPELTTSDGLSDEVTLVTYDQLQGYRIQTRSSGDYWIYVDHYTHVIVPAHYTPTAIAASTP